MSTFSGYVRHTTVTVIESKVTMQDGSTVTVSISGDKLQCADPTIVTEWARQVGEATGKHCQEQESSGIFNKIKGFFGKGKGKGKQPKKNNKVEDPSDGVPITQPPKGVIQTNLTVNRNTKHIDEPLPRKHNTTASKKITFGDLIAMKNELKSTKSSGGSDKSVKMKTTGGMGDITPDMLSLRRRTLRKTDMNTSTTNNMGMFGSSTVNAMLTKANK